MAILTTPTIQDLPSEVDPSSNYGHWIVTVFDNDFNTTEEVTAILIRATNCTLEEAEIETWEIHYLGKSVVHHGSERNCREIADVIATIGIQVEVAEE